MATLLEAKPITYEELFKKMSVDLATITKDEVHTNDVNALTNLHLYWNRLVTKAMHWQKVAERELDNFMSIKKIKRYIKNKLIEECTRVMHKINRLECLKHSTQLRQKNLLEELNDRLIYIKKTF